MLLKSNPRFVKDFASFSSATGTEDNRLSLSARNRSESNPENPSSEKYSKMQLDVDVSTPANIITYRLTLTDMTFDPDSCDR